MTISKLFDQSTRRVDQSGFSRNLKPPALAGGVFTGVMLVADSRITVHRAGRPDVHADICQKIFPLTNSLAIGFAGDVAAAAFILTELRAQLAKRERRDVVSLVLRWLPRFMKARYAKYGKNRPVHFMIVAVRRDQPNVVERQKVVDIMKTIATGNASIQRSFIPDVVMQMMLTPASATHVAIQGTVQGILCKLSSPDFRPVHFSPLEYCAIGSGASTTHEIARTADWLLAGRPGNDLVESMALRDAVTHFVAAESIPGVGGMYPCVKIDHRGVGCLGVNQTLRKGRFTLLYDASKDRWTQANEATGKSIELLYPWEIDVNTITVDKRFDDWWDANVDFNPLRGKRV
jgi:hypothetical protein